MAIKPIYKPFIESNYSFTFSTQKMFKTSNKMYADFDSRQRLNISI